MTRDLHHEVEWPVAPENSKSPAATAIVAVNYNTKRLIAQLVYSLFARLGRAGFASLLVVDNASSDGSLELLQALAAAGLIELIANDENLYHGPALNQALDHLAIAQKGGAKVVSAVWVLDSDCVVLREDTLAAATELMTSSRAALIGQPVVDKWHAGDFGMHSLLIDPVKVWRRDIESFQDHGEPSKALQASCAAAGLVAAPFGFTSEGYVLHVGRGTIASVGERNETDNRFFDWAKDHSDPHYAGEVGGEAAFEAFRREFDEVVATLSPAVVVEAIRATLEGSS